MITVKINSDSIKTKDIGTVVNLPVVVKVVGDFTESSANALYTDCDNAIKTGQTILPIFIDSFGGQVDSLVGMIDYMQSIKDNGVEIVTIACGKAMSCGAILFCMGDRRYVGRTTRLMFHRVFSASAGNPDNLVARGEETSRLEKMVLENASKNIGKKKNWIFDGLKERNFVDWYLSPDELLKENIATHIGIPKMTFGLHTTFNLE